MLSRGVAEGFISLFKRGRDDHQFVRFLKLLRNGVRPVSSPISKGLILAQNERWRRGLGMQVGRAARPVAEG